MALTVSPRPRWRSIAIARRLLVTYMPRGCTANRSSGRRTREPARHDVLPRDHDARRPGDGLRLAHQRRLRPGQRLPQDAHVRAAGRARVRPADQRQPLLHAVGHHPAPPRLRPGPGPRAGAVALRRRPRHRRAGPPGLRHGPRRARARRLQVQRPPPPRRAGARASRPASSSSTRRATRCRRPRTRRTCRSARRSTAGRSSTAASASSAPRWRRRRSTRCSRSTRRCART